MLALHLRGTDKLRSEAPQNAQIVAEPDSLVQRVKDMMERTQSDAVFSCSDDAAWKENVMDRLRRSAVRVYTFDAELGQSAPGGVGVHFNPRVRADRSLHDMCLELGVAGKLL